MRKLPKKKPLIVVVVVVIIALEMMVKVVVPLRMCRSSLVWVQLMPPPLVSIVQVVRKGKVARK